MHPLSPSSSADSEGKQTYAMQVLLEEVAALRRRVKELDDDGSTGARSGPSVETADNSEQGEIVQLRKELVKVENERAAMELQFMNQLSSFARENQDSVDDLRSKLFKKEEELAVVKARRMESGEGRVDELMEEIEKMKADHAEETQRLKRDLDAAQKELRVTRGENEELVKRNDSLENQRNALIDEITGLRLEVENDARVITSLQEEMDELEKHHNTKLDKMQVDISGKDATISRHNDELAEMNDVVIKLEEKKGMLLDEVTDLRMILDREEKVKHDMKKRLEDFESKTSKNGEAGDVLPDANEQRARAAEERVSEFEQQIETLQNELRSVTASYKSGVSRLEDSLATKESVLEDVRNDYKERQAKVDELEAVVEALEGENIELKGKVEEVLKKSSQNEREVATLSSHRVAYEKRMTQTISDHVTEIDHLKEQKQTLASEITSLRSKLETQTEACKKLQAEIADMRKTPIRYARALPTPSPISTSSPTSPRIAAGGYSPGQGTVRALAACFEGRSSSGLPDYVHPTPGSGRPVFEDPGEMQQALYAEIDQNEALQKKLDEQTSIADELREEIASLTATRTAIQAVSRREYERRTEMDQEEINKLKEQLEGTRVELEDETMKVQELKSEIKDLTSDRLSYEEKAMKAYDQRAAHDKKFHVAELNKLKVTLTKSQMKIQQLERDYPARIRELEDTIDDLNHEMDQELEDRQNEIDLIHGQLSKQTDEVRRLESEREQLCITMNSMSNSRRVDLEELQSALMEKSAENTSFSRKIQALEMQVENHRQYTGELEALRRRVKELESKASPKGTGAHIMRMELEDMQDENRRLRDQVRTSAIERRALQEKLNTVIAQKSANRSLQVLRDRNEKLKREVEKLTKRLQKSEGTVTRIAI